MYYQNYGYFHNKRRSHQMETASLLLGLIAISTSCAVYTSLVCGALGILFALLARGGEMTLAPKAKVGLVLSVISLIIVIYTFVYTIDYAYTNFGSIEEMIESVYESMGIDYEALMGIY